jgi:hypothetical protein
VAERRCRSGKCQVGRQGQEDGGLLLDSGQCTPSRGSAPARETTGDGSNLLRPTTAPSSARYSRLIKWWNHRVGAPLQSFHIEVIALKAISTKIDGDYPWHVHRWFSTANETIGTDLWHDGGYVDEYLTYSKRAQLQGLLHQTAFKARWAWYHTYNGRGEDHEAIQLWRSIFGNRFPAYG